MKKEKKLLINGNEVKKAIKDLDLTFPIHLSVMDKKTKYYFKIRDEEELEHYRMPRELLFDYSKKPDGTYIAFSDGKNIPFVSEQELIVLFGVERAREIFDEGSRLSPEEVIAAIGGLYRK